MWHRVTMSFTWRSPWVIATGVFVVLLTGACSSDEDEGADPADDTSEDASSTESTTSVGETSESALPGDDLRLNEVQTLGSHNSYHLPAIPEVADALQGLVPALWETISYEHQPLTEQLEDYGIRQFELDVYADPDGGTYANPGAYQLLSLRPPDAGELDDPGFKVAHIADIDRNTTCLTFVACLEEIHQWSADNPDHLPLMVMVETKGDDLRDGGGDFGVDVDTLGVDFARPLEMTPELFDDLEAEVRSVFDEEELIVPDDVRGDADSLEEAVLDGGWPTVGESRGKVLFSLVDTGDDRELYVEDAPNLAGKLFFTSSEPGRPDAAFLRIDDSTAEPDELLEAAEAGYLIRTRTDEPGIHAVSGDTSLRDSALASGGNYLSTDYYVAADGTGYVVALPGGAVARCNPVSAPADCDEITEG